MDATIVDFTLVTFLRAVSLDIEQLLYEATILLNTASLISRLAKEG